MVPRCRRRHGPWSTVDNGSVAAASQRHGARAVHAREDRQHPQMEASKSRPRLAQRFVERRTKDTFVTVEADEEDVSLLEEGEEEEGKDDDNQEEFPAPSVQAAPEPAGPSRLASVPDRLSRLMAINLVHGNGSALKRL